MTSSLRRSSSSAPPAPTSSSSEFRLTDEEVRTLGEGGLLVRDGWLGEHAAACALAAARLEDELTPARMGKDRRLRPNVRGDYTAWFSELDLPPSLEQLWARFELLRGSVNRDVWLGLASFELQLACYPGEGARYAPHLDAFQNDEARRLTAICYLNPDWRPEHGGQLHAWTPDGEVWVEPRLDRWVVFLSDRVRHEVLPSYAPRFAATAWYRGAVVVPWRAD